MTDKLEFDLNEIKIINPKYINNIAKIVDMERKYINEYRGLDFDINNIRLITPDEEPFKYKVTIDVYPKEVSYLASIIINGETYYNGDVLLLENGIHKYVSHAIGYEDRVEEFEINGGNRFLKIELNKLWGRAKLDVRPDDANIIIDGLDGVYHNGDTVNLSYGTHNVRCSYNGYEDEEQTIDLTDSINEERKIRFRLKKKKYQVTFIDIPEDMEVNVHGYGKGLIHSLEAGMYTFTISGSSVYEDVNGEFFIVNEDKIVSFESTMTSVEITTIPEEANVRVLNPLIRSKNFTLPPGNYEVSVYLEPYYKPKSISLDVGDNTVRKRVTLERKIYQIHFRSNGGSSIPSKDVNVGENPNKPPDPSRNFHDFDGWYLDESYNNKYDFNSPLEHDSVLIAKWIPHTYTVRFLSDGNIYREFNGVPYGSSIDETIPTPEKLGYVFIEWDNDYSYINKDMDINAVFEEV